MLKAKVCLSMCDLLVDIRHYRVNKKTHQNDVSDNVIVKIKMTRKLQGKKFSNF